MIIWNSLKLFPHIHDYLFIFANTEIYVIKYKTIEKLSRRHLINSSDVFVIKGFTVDNIKKILLYSYLATAVLFLKSVISILSSNISSDSAVKKCNLKY